MQRWWISLHTQILKSIKLYLIHTWIRINWFEEFAKVRISRLIDSIEFGISRPRCWILCEPSYRGQKTKLTLHWRLRCDWQSPFPWFWSRKKPGGRMTRDPFRFVGSVFVFTFLLSCICIGIWAVQCEGLVVLALANWHWSCTFYILN